MTDQGTFLVADFSKGEFPTIQGFPHLTQRSIMPVVAIRGQEIRPVGSCFAISNQGLVLTAAHVIDEALHPSRDDLIGDGPWSLGALYAAEKPGGGTDVLGGILPALTVHRNGILDIAVMHLNLPVRQSTNERLRMPSLKISPGIPDNGSTCIGLGYHSMTWNRSFDRRHTHEVKQSYSASKGKIEEIYFPRRDSIMCPFPSFLASARFDKGMSGGPVFGSSNNVIGVICSAISSKDGATSLLDEEGYISFASLIGPALFLQLDAADVDTVVRPQFLYDFTVGGSVILDETAKALTIDRLGDRLVINFGLPPTFESSIGS